MSNSSLSCMRVISPNRNSPRNHKIDTITIHCTAGQADVEAFCTLFANPNYQASCNYVIGRDGRIATIVDEGDRSWCSSNAANDNRAVTIECASDATHPYAINAQVWNSLVKLCADICKRNGIQELKWQANPALVGQTDKQNMTVHRWFANKACPGDYIYERLGQIAAEVNKILKGDDDMTAEQTRQIFQEEYAKKNPTYNTIDDVPSYWREDIRQLMNAGIIKGTGGGKLGMTYSETKAAVIVKRGLQKAGLV